MSFSVIRSTGRLAVVLITILGCGLALAQPASLDAVDQSGGSVSGTLPGSGDVLWDNTAINNTASGIISTAFSTLPVGADRTNTADDFVIPPGALWNIQFVYSEGFSNLPIDADGFEIVFYEDNSGGPGTVIDSQTIPFGGVVNMTTQELTLPNPVNLSSGTYWVSVIGVYDTGTTLAAGRWNWSTGPDAIGSDWFLQDTVGFFGFLPWTPATGLGITDVSTLFALRGSSMSPLPESQPVPALDNAGLILLVLMLAMIGVLAVRRTS